DGRVRTAADWRRADRPPDPEMVKGGGDGRREVVRDQGRDSARGGGFARAGKSLPALCARSMGAGMAAEGSARGGHYRALRGRRGAGVSIPGRGYEVPGGIAGASAEVRAGTASGEDASDRIRALCRGTAVQARGREAGNLQFSGFHSYVWEEPYDGVLHGVAEDDGEAHGSEAERNSAEAEGAAARSNPGHDGVAEVGGSRIFPIPRHPV